MTRESFNQILSTKTALDTAQTKELNIVLEEFPYFQAARALRLKGLHQNHSFSYNAGLKKTAAYTTDRSVLFDYITSEEFKQHDISDQLKARQQASVKTEDFDEAITMNQKEAGQVLDPGLFEESKEKKQADKGLEVSTPDKPLEFNKTQAHSFSEWLKLTSAKPISREENPKKTGRENDIITKFIEKNPKITRPDKVENQPSIKNHEPGNHLMTETLARIYAEQKNYDKAIQAYKILILKNPEKSGLFADQIKAIELSKENKNT